MTAKTSDSVVKTNSTQAEIGLVCALPMELSDFFSRCSKVKTYTGGKFTFRGGFYKETRIAMVESGMGSARAKRATAALLEAHQPRWIISTGFCGALYPQMQVGQIVVANEVTNLQDEPLRIDIGIAADPARGLYVGRTLTVDKMVRTKAEKQELAEKTGAIAVDMETYGIAQQCRELKTRFLAVRAVSDDLSADLPKEILSLVGETGSVRFGAVVGALLKRPGSYKDMWQLREKALIAADRLADFLDGVILQLHASP
ncbi:phosphorylase family protein [Schlesneria sp.]|uniref:phosphorylase family protein n=1 Tax=Schlesneria sp. TaxID=2762018 RepID=UPI002F1D87CE